MNLEVNQANLYLFLPSKVSRVADMLAADKAVGIVEALRVVYSSDTYKLLEDEATKKWCEGPVALYQSLESYKRSNREKN